MFELQKKSKVKRIIQSPLALVFLCIILVILAKAAWRVYHKENLSRENLERQEAELLKLSSREEDLKKSIEFLKTEEGVESEIRSKFRLAKEGESIAVILDDGASNTAQASVQGGIGETSSFWQKLLKFLPW